MNRNIKKAICLWQQLSDYELTVDLINEIDKSVNNVSHSQPNRIRHNVDTFLFIYFFTAHPFSLSFNLCRVTGTFTSDTFFREFPSTFTLLIEEKQDLMWTCPDVDKSN